MDGEFFDGTAPAQRRCELGHKVLLIAASHTGNNVFCTPAIRLLKRQYSHAMFDVVALNRQSADVFKGNPDVRHCHVADRAWQINLLAGRYDSVICLHPKSRQLVRDLKRDVYAIPTMLEDQHHAEQVLRFAAKLAGATVTDHDRGYVLPTSDAVSCARIDTYLDTPGSRYVGIHLGCGRTSIHGWKFFYKARAIHPKLWPAERYTELALRLVAADPTVRIVVTGTRNEAFLAKSLAQQVPGTINLIGKTRIADLNHLMSRLALYIAHDCGLMHVAAATTVPLIALFGPTDPVYSGPYPPRTRHVLIRKPSMAAISVDEVLQAAQAHLAARS